MNSSKRFLLLITFWVFSGCARHAYITTWKATNIMPRSYSKILVVAVIHDSDLTLRRNMEVHFVDDLQHLGYTAVSCLAEFGPKGLANLDQEATYRMLCNRGIEGVITIALIDVSKENTFIPAHVKFESNQYYYNRIWNYRQIAADLNKKKKDTFSAAVRWESIFFDITTLEPLYIVQTKSLDVRSVENDAQRYGKTIASSMVKNKILRKQAPVKTDSLKAF